LHYFPSERAWWFHLIAWGVFPGTLVLLLIQQFRDPIPWMTWFLTAFLPILLSAGFTLWIWFGTGYTITETHLIIRSAFFSWRYPLAEITRVRPTRNPLASPALSLNRLEIRTRKGLCPLISPADREGFLKLLRERCPQADIRG